MSNPVLKQDTFRGQSATGDRMTLGGTINRTAMLLALMMITAGWTWLQYFSAETPAAVAGYLVAGVVGGLVMSLITIFFKQYSAYTAPAYALFEGLAIGGISAMAEQKFPGVAIQAALLTFGIMGVMLVSYKNGWLRATPRFTRGVLFATGGIALLYLVDLVLMFFGMPIGFIHQGGPMGLLFSGVVVAIAALNLIVDFDMIEGGVAMNSPKYMEWYSAFALILTLVWLYLEVLRMLGKARSR